MAPFFFLSSKAAFGLFLHFGNKINQSVRSGLIECACFGFACYTIQCPSVPISELPLT